MFFIGVFALINQAIKLVYPVIYYGHDTFDSLQHPYSFVANRANLFLSWCVVIPLYATYLTLHIWISNRLIRIAKKRAMLDFYLSHPDRAGGYSFFGYMNFLYMLGLFVILIQTSLLIYTHGKMDLSNIAPLLLVGVGFVLVSLGAMFGVNKALREVEGRMKARAFLARLQAGSPMDPQDFALIYSANFSPYNYLTARLMLTLRLISFGPAAYKVVQYSL
jgi:hypothetical protein